MPNKILVPTDLSENSKNGIRFAIQLASQDNSTLIFYTCMELIKPVKWKEAQFKAYVREELDTRKGELVAFIDQCYAEANASKGKFECVVERGADPRKSVVKYAVGVKASFICMATRGAGNITKVMGTNASGVLSQSPIPVFVIPDGYVNKKISKVVYASDLEHLASELKRVTKFTTSLNADLYVYHYSDKVHEPAVNRKLLTVQQKYTSASVSFVFDTVGERSFAEKLEADLLEAKASLAVLFTNQKRNWFDRLFSGSNSAEVSYTSDIPILVFAKA